MVAEKRKPRPAPAPYNRQPKTSDVDPSRRPCRQNLTLSDWLSVFAYVDAHPSVSQKDVVEHFKTLQSRPLLFTQSTLSRKLKERPGLEKRVDDNPSALSSKRPRVVTRPDVERALFLWIKRMDARGERVNGPMLKEKRRRFEELFNVPDEECLTGEGWLTSFRRTYKICDHRHSEATSTDTSVVDIEQPALITEGGDEAIVAAVTQEMAEKDEVIEVDSDDDEAASPVISRSDTIKLCDQFVEACLQREDTRSELESLGLLASLRNFRDKLQRQEPNHMQTTLDAYLVNKPSSS